MYKYIFLLSALTFCGFSYALEDLTGTPIEACYKCICYARTAKWDIRLCGRQMMTFSNWEASGSPSSSTSGTPWLTWISCRQDVHCILNSFKKFTEQSGGKASNLDGEFDCRDRFSNQIHRTNVCVTCQIPSIFFDRFDSCLPSVMEAERISRNKQRELDDNKEVTVEGNVKGGTNKVEQIVEVEVEQNVKGNANREEQNVEVKVEQNVKGNTNQSEENVDVVANQNLGGNANQAVKVVVEQNA